MRGLARAERRSAAPVLWQTAPAAFVVLAFVLVPLVILARISLYETDQSFTGAYGWSLRHYVKFFASPYYLGILGQTIAYGFIVAGVTLLLGFPVGYALGRMPPRRRRWRLVVVILPLTLSLVVNVFGWLVILGGNGLVNNLLLGVGLTEVPLKLLYSPTAVLIVLIHTFLPFQILSIMSVTAQIDPTLEEAAAGLRGSRWVVLRRVVLPLALPGIVSGSTLVFILTASAFVTPRLIGGPRLQMLGSLIFEQVLAGMNWPFGATMSVVLLVIVLLLVGLAAQAVRFWHD
jgi:putative spermidine/putrescine transport system permease protein